MRIAAIRCIQRNKFGFLDLFSWGAELSSRALNCLKAACISSGEVDDVVSSNSSHKENNNFLASWLLPFLKNQRSTLLLILGVHRSKNNWIVLVWLELDSA